MERPVWISIIFISIALNASGFELETKELGTLIGSTTKTAWTSRTIYQFLSVRYGISPSGPRRFKPPKLAIPWPGKHNVSKYARPCPTMKHILNTTKIDLTGDLEDCLHLSIYSKSTSGKQPVMLFVYGGSLGDGTPAQYPPNYLLEKDIVLVVPQYRLGPFGYLSTQTNEIPGNAAVHDIILALNWTQSFIHYFGGDRLKVTLFGHGSGAAIASALLFSPSVPAGLFHRVILQSGSILSTQAFEFNPVRNARSIAKLACNNSVTIDDVNKCFMQMDVITLLSSYGDYVHNSRTGGLVESSQNKLTYSDLLPLPPIDLINRRNSIKNIPLMAGVTKHDGSYIFSVLLEYLIENFGTHFDEINKSYTLDIILEFLGLKDYTGTLSGFAANALFDPNEIVESNLTTIIDGLVDLCGTVTVKAPLLKLAQAQARYHSNTTFLYTFDYKSQRQYLHNKSALGSYDGVHHFSDILYLFPFAGFATNLTADDKRVAKKMVSLWTSFAVHGIPISEEVGRWPALTKYIGPYMHISKSSKMGNNFLDEYTIAARDAHRNHCTQSRLSIVVFLIISLFIAFSLF